MCDNGLSPNAFQQANPEPDVPADQRRFYFGVKCLVVAVTYTYMRLLI